MFKLALIVAIAGLALLGCVAARLRDPARTLLLGTVAGLGYGVLGIAARVLTGFAPLTLLRDPAAYAVVAAGIVSFVFYATALEGGSVTVATAAIVLAETLPPAVIGVIFLGDKTRPGLQPAAAIGFLLAVASAVMLARFGEADRAVAKSAQLAPPAQPADAQPAGPAESATAAQLPAIPEAASRHQRRPSRTRTAYPPRARRLTASQRYAGPNNLL